MKLQKFDAIQMLENGGLLRVWGSEGQLSYKGRTYEVDKRSVVSVMGYYNVDWSALPIAFTLSKDGVLKNNSEPMQEDDNNSVHM